MFKKGNRYYADWRDADGKRLRRSFTNATDATKAARQKLPLSQTALSRASVDSIAPVAV